MDLVTQLMQCFDVEDLVNLRSWVVRLPVDERAGRGARCGPAVGRSGRE